jgi:hypothetical protein
MQCGRERLADLKNNLAEHEVGDGDPENISSF